MVDWVAGMADASVSERDSGSVLVRVPGSPDVLKEAAVSGFLTKDASGNVGIGTASPVASVEVYKPYGTTGSDTNINVLVLTAVDNTGGYYYENQGAGIAFRSGIVAGATLGPEVMGAIYGSNMADNSVADGQLTFHTRRSNILTERLRINQNGHFSPGVDNAQTMGTAVKRLSVVYAGTGTINTSDERAKTDIGEMPEAWLDAWSGVEWRRFKMVDGNRWHVGLVAQQVHAAFAAHDLDAFEIGICCFDAWDEVREPIFEMVTKTRKATRTEQIPAGEDENGEPLFKLVEVAFDEEYEESIDTGKTRVTLEAGDRWGLRYDECQAIEAAYQRRELSRMAARLAALENGGQGLGA